jgi:hypothetical protein
VAHADRGLGASLRAAALACAAGACGCAATPRPTVSAPAPVPAVPAVVYDWHPLLIVPFGTLLKDVPLALNEVLEFHGSESDAPIENRDCFSIDGASPPEVLGRRPEKYLLCFEHDRLHRIEALLRLAPAETESMPDLLCQEWLDGAADRERTPEGCAGSVGEARLAVHLASAADTARTLSISLTDAKPRD